MMPCEEEDSTIPNVQFDFRSITQLQDTNPDTMVGEFMSAYNNLRHFHPFPLPIWLVVEISDEWTDRQIVFLPCCILLGSSMMLSHCTILAVSSYVVNKNILSFKCWLSFSHVFDNFLCDIYISSNRKAS